MSMPLQQRMDAALAELEEQREKIREFHTEAMARSTVVTSKNRMVAATVDSRGKLVGLSLKGNRYRSMAPAELAALIVETVAKAQDTALRESLTRAFELIPNAKRYIGFGAGGPDLDEIFESSMRLVEEPIFDEHAGSETDGPVTRDA